MMVFLFLWLTSGLSNAAGTFGKYVAESCLLVGRVCVGVCRRLSRTAVPVATCRRSLRLLLLVRQLRCAPAAAAAAAMLHSRSSHVVVAVWRFWLRAALFGAWRGTALSEQCQT